MINLDIYIGRVLSSNETSSKFMACRFATLLLTLCDYDTHTQRCTSVLNDLQANRGWCKFQT